MALRQRVLRDVSAIDLSTELFGQRWAMPVGLGPVGLSGLYARRGECQAAKAAAAARRAVHLVDRQRLLARAKSRRPATCPGTSSISSRTAGSSREMIARAKAAGCGALILTVDLAVPGSRYRDAPGCRAAGCSRIRATAGAARMAVGRRRSRPAAQPRQPRGRSSASARRWPISRRWIHANFDPSVSWKDVEWVRAAVGRPADHQGHPRPR